MKQVVLITLDTSFLMVSNTTRVWEKRSSFSLLILSAKQGRRWYHFLCPATRKWRGIMLYPPKFWVSVRPSVSAHHHSCIGNSSYSFGPILLKLYRCFKDGLKICILFFQNPEIIFYHFFPIFNLDIFRALILQICIWSMYLVSETPPTVFGESFWNFTGVLRMVWRYAYCFFRILKLFFITFYAFLT